MAGKDHRYTTVVEWTGNTGSGTSSYRAYSRQHRISSPGHPKPSIPGSSDPGFRGDAACWNPEELLVASISTCHQLWYLHLCADAGLVITSYVDRAEGVMTEDADGGGRFRSVTLRPVVTFAPGADLDRALELHHEAHRLCFIANSVNFPVEHEPELRSA
jgi:organic hydroperoxide reductase OsmC/OhrA